MSIIHKCVRRPHTGVRGLQPYIQKEPFFKLMQKGEERNNYYITSSITILPVVKYRTRPEPMTSRLPEATATISNGCRTGGQSNNYWNTSQWCLDFLNQYLTRRKQIRAGTHITRVQFLTSIPDKMETDASILPEATATASQNIRSRVRVHCPCVSVHKHSHEHS